MRRNRSDRRHWLAIMAVAALGLSSSSGTADDTALFTAIVPPNVMMMIDNSGSMNNLVWHPAFDPTVTPTCRNYNDDTTYSFSGNLQFTVCGKNRKLYSDTLISNRTRIDGRYLNWYFSPESDPYHDGAVDGLYALTNGTTSNCLIAQGEPPTYSKYRRSRVTAARQVLREVVCQVNAVGDVRFGLSQFYRGSDPVGGYVKVGINDYDAVHGANLDAGIDELEGETWTPLSETLYNVYRYFQSRSQPALGKDGITEFPWYDILLDGSTTSTRSSSPPSPVQYACQKNFIVVITDGEPTKDDFDSMNLTRFRDQLIGDYNPDNATPENGNESWGSTCAFCNETTWYLDDVAKFMFENDFQRDFDGDQTIDTYTVGFTTSPTANAILQKTASVGNGLFFYSNNAEELAMAIVSTITDIIEKSQSFTAATVPASRATDGNNFYASFFLPQGDSAYWEGHLKNFEFNAAGEIRDAAGNCALDDPQAPTRCQGGPLLTNATGFWDAATALPAALSRKLYFSNYGSVPPIVTPVLPAPFNTANVSATALVTGGDVLGASPYAVSDFPSSTASTGNDLRDFIVEYVAGCTWGSAPCQDRSKKLWDVFHSNPLLVGSPNASHRYPSYWEFAEKYSLRKRVLYAGSNGGFVHGFNSGEWDTSVDPDAFDRGTGVEEMGFMTYPARQKIKELGKDRPTPKQYFMDGSPQAADVWFYPSPSASPSQVDEWHTVLLGNMREGGNVIWALDVTDPPDAAYPNGRNSSLPYPGYLWEFPCEANDVKCNGRGAYTYSKYMGQTWSDPIVTRIRVKVGGDDNQGEGYDRWVVIFGGGYSEEGDPNLATSYDGTSGAATSRAGRAVFMVDIQTGDPIAMKRFSDNQSTGDPRMKFSFAATPTIFDLDFDGYADVVYFADLGGNIWKWVIKDLAVLPANGPVASDLALDQPDWAWIKLFEADHCVSDAGANPVTCPEDHYRSLFFPPTGSLIHGTLWLAFGSGERANLGFPGYPNSTRENNRFYVMKDQDPWEMLGTPVVASARYDDFAGSTDFAAVGAEDTCGYPNDPEVGYYIAGVDGEKFITNSVIFFGDVFTLSFRPEGAADPCSAGGISALYGFDLRCGQGTFETGSGTVTTTTRSFDVGGGVPNRPRVSVGPIHTPDSCQGGNCGGGNQSVCQNMVVVITSDGTAYSDSPNNDCPSGIRLNSWRDF